MLDYILIKIAKSKISSKFQFSRILEDIPNNFFIEHYSEEKLRISGSIVFISLVIALISGIVLSFFDLFLGIISIIVIFLGSILFLLRKVRGTYLSQILEVEQYSDLICREMILVYNSTNSLGIVLEYLSKSDYPYISTMISKMMKQTNIKSSLRDSFIEFANSQPSETIKEFILETLIPLDEGYLKFNNLIILDTQWRIRQKFNSYISQIEGKLSIFLAITTIIPITISMLLVMLGHVNFYLMIFLPLLFLIFDLIAVEVFNSGSTELLGGG